jgi:hypothetical protein
MPAMKSFLTLDGYYEEYTTPTMNTGISVIGKF